MRSYAVTWTGKTGRVHAGKLEIGDEALTLEGGSARQTIPYGDLAELHVGRTPDERLQGRTALVLTRRRGETLHVTSLNGVGEIVEIAELIAPRAGL